MSQFEFIDKRVPIALDNPAKFMIFQNVKTVRCAVALAQIR